MEYDEWFKERVVSNEHTCGGAFVFKGTRVPVSHVGALVFRGYTKEIKQDYPYLSYYDLKYAEMFYKNEPC